MTRADDSAEPQADAGADADGGFGVEGGAGAYWDQVAQRVGRRRHYLDAFLGDMKRQAHLGLVAQWGGVPQGGRLLKTDLFEEAAGPDALLPALAGGGAQVVGMDVSVQLVHQARRRGGAAPGWYVAADVRRLPFAPATFDLIISPSTLDHFADPSDLQRSLAELARVLKPGGRIIVTVDNRQNVTDLLLRLAMRLKLVPYYLGRSYSVHELRRSLEAAGLQVRDTTAILHNPRLFAVGATAAAKALRLRVFATLVQRILVAMQRFGRTRWRYRTGSFVAALAVRPGNDNHNDEAPSHPLTPW